MLGGRWLAGATAALTGYDTDDLAATLGGLQLVPENAGRLYGLEAAAVVAARLAFASGRPAPTPAQWRDLFDGPGGALRATLPDEDPLENPFVDELVFDGRAYRFLPSLEDEAPFVLRHLTAAVMAMADDARTAAFATSARRLCHAALALGDAVCRRAGLPRGCPPGADLAGPVRVPDGDALAALKQAVRFEPEGLEQVLAVVGADLADLAPLVAEQGPTFPLARWATGTPALGAPVARCATRYVVVGPLALVSRLRHVLVSPAAEAGVTDRLAEAFRAAVFGSVTRSLGFLGCDLLWQPTAVDLDGTPATMGFFGLDTDKVVHALVVADDLRTYDRMDPLGAWPLPGVAGAIEQHLATAEANAFRTQPRLREMLHLVIVQGVGRFWRLDPACSRLSPRSRRLTLTAADLETLGLLEGGTRHRLWQFAGASARLREHTTVRRWSLLDEYDVWRGQGYSFYFGDGVRPTFVSFPPGGAGNLRREVQREHDIHGSIDPTTGAVAEVIRLHGDPDVPIYFPWKSADDRITVLAEVPSGPYWVVAAGGRTPTVDRSLTAEVAEAIAYWLWQVDPGLRSATAGPGISGGAQTVLLSIVPDPSWSGAGGASGGVDPVTCARVDIGTVHLHLGAGAGDLFATPDNAGERHVLRRLLEVLGEPTIVDGVPARRALATERIDVLIERHAPLGLKKKFFLVPRGADPRLDDRGLPPFRAVQEPDEEVQLDEVGEFVRTQLGYGAGPIPPEHRTAVLRAVVDSWFAELEALVGTLDPQGLLEALVEHHEAILAAQTMRELTIPTRLACFGTAEQLAARLRQEIPGAAKAATASRVLIEHVTARPPAGDRPLSLATYDRLLAVVSQLQQRAFTSDEIHYGLVDHPLEVLPSGRLGMDRDAYLAAQEAFSRVRMLGEMGRGTAEFGRHWRDLGDGSPLDDEAMARATAEEFGLPIGHLVDFLGAVIDVGQAITGAAKVLAEADLRGRLAGALGWPDADVRIAFEVFAERARADFRVPPEPYTAKDAEPWNYTRALSYLRKPLLVRESAIGETVVWGNRNVFVAGLVLVSLCLGGRYQPRTQALRRIVGRQREIAGKEFNDEVAALFEGTAGFVVRRRFKKAGKLRIQRPIGQDLGDIDILVADRRQRRLLAVEAKNLAGARTPVEFSKDVHEVLEPRGERSASIDKHLERVAWLRDHRAEVLRSLGLPAHDADLWTTDALVVVNIESLAPFLVPPRVRVVSVEQLKQELGAQPSA